MASLGSDGVDQLANVAQALDLCVGELDLEGSLYGDNQADVGEAVPFLDVCGGRLTRHLEIVKIERVGHDLADTLQNAVF